jgi:hypothetical protein
VIALYAFTLELAELPQLGGIDGEALVRWEVEGLTAVGTRHDAPPQGDPREDALAQGFVVEALTALAPAVLPVRFGETFADQAALRDAVCARADELRRALERVRDCAEIGVRVGGDEPVTAAASGTDYMRARLADEARVGALHERIAPVARASTCPRGGAACYLVERARVPEVLRSVDEFAAAHPELSVSRTGPWAPYSFGSDR